MPTIAGTWPAASESWGNTTNAVTTDRAIIMIHDNTWRIWNSNYTTCASSGTSYIVTNDQAWAQWLRVNGAAWTTPPAPPTQLELERQRQQAEQVRQAQVEVRERAEEILRAHLTPEQKQELERLRYFTVRGQTGRLYRVWAGKGRHGNIQEVTNEGGVIASLCCAPVGNLPEADALLGQKLFLEMDEETFRKTANIRRIAA